MMGSGSYTEIPSYQDMMRLLEVLGYELTPANPNEPVPNLEHRDELEVFKWNDNFVYLDQSNTDKHNFYKIFANRGWQPELGKMSPHGPRSGPSAQVDSLNNPVSTIWEFKSEIMRMSLFPSTGVDAELLAEGGKGDNKWIYIWGGYIAFYPEGYSNMMLIEWFDSYDNDSNSIDPSRGGMVWDGEIHYGEKAFQRFKELRTRPYETIFYPSINRRRIP